MAKTARNVAVLTFVAAMAIAPRPAAAADGEPPRVTVRFTPAARSSLFSVSMRHGGPARPAVAVTLKPFRRLTVTPRVVALNTSNDLSRVSGSVGVSAQVDLQNRVRAIADAGRGRTRGIVRFDLAKGVRAEVSATAGSVAASGTSVRISRLRQGTLSAGFAHGLAGKRPSNDLKVEWKWSRARFGSIRFEDRRSASITAPQRVRRVSIAYSALSIGGSRLHLAAQPTVALSVAKAGRLRVSTQITGRAHR